MITSLQVAPLLEYLNGSGADQELIDGQRELAEDVLAGAKQATREFADLYGGFVLLDDYYRGEPPLPRQPARLTGRYKDLLLTAQSNWCALVVDVVNERLEVSSTVSGGNPSRDPLLWAWWTANNMQQHSGQIHAASLLYGCCYVSVWPATQPGGAPVILGESPLTTHVSIDDATGQAWAAIRIWQNRATGQVYADYTTEEWQYRLVSDQPATMRTQHFQERVLVALDPESLSWRFRDDTEPIRVNPLGEVPYRKLRTQPDLMGGYRSEIRNVLPIQDRINRTNFDRLVTQEFAAFPQRWVTGIDVPVDPKTGQPREPFDAAVDRIWTSNDPDTKMGQFPAAHLDSYLEAATADVQALATQSRTPPHYLLAGMGNFPSGESVRATEYGLTRKVQARQVSYGDTWGDVLRLCAKAAGEKELAEDSSVGVLWADVEARSEGELVDALLKMGSLGVPRDALWQRWGATPAEVDAWREANAAAPNATDNANQTTPVFVLPPAGVGAVPQTPPVEPEG